MRLKAFTLIELLVVIAIIGILISISVVGWFSVSARGRDSQRKSDLNRIKQVLLQQYGDTRTFPAFDTSKGGGLIYGASWQLRNTTTAIMRCRIDNEDDNRLPSKYLDKIPTDPKDVTIYKDKLCSELTLGQSNRYIYISSPTDAEGPVQPATGFGLMATLEQNKADWIGDALNPLKSGSTTVFGSWYSTGRDNYGQGNQGIGVNANYLVDSQTH